MEQVGPEGHSIVITLRCTGCHPGNRSVGNKEVSRLTVRLDSEFCDEILLYGRGFETLTQSYQVGWGISNIMHAYVSLEH
jgi:hypothetical protein